jgi:hypothetical protein
LTKENFEFICERRGFNNIEIQSLKDGFNYFKLEMK